MKYYKKKKGKIIIIIVITVFIDLDAKTREKKKLYRERTRFLEFPCRVCRLSDRLPFHLLFIYLLILCNEVLLFIYCYYIIVVIGVIKILFMF